MLLGTTIMSIGAIIQIASFGVPEMIVGRIVAGIGNGINTSTGQYTHYAPCNDDADRGSTCVAGRNIESELARQTDYHRDDHEHLRFLTVKLGHLRLFVSTANRSP